MTCTRWPIGLSPPHYNREWFIICFGRSCRNQHECFAFHTSNWIGLYQDMQVRTWNHGTVYQTSAGEFSSQFPGCRQPRCGAHSAHGPLVREEFPNDDLVSFIFNVWHKCSICQGRLWKGCGRNRLLGRFHFSRLHKRAQEHTVFCH